MKKVLYTCITGEYDDVCAHTYIDDGWDYVLFTDNQYLLGMGQYMHWGVRPLFFYELGNVKNARWHKINAHILFPEYDYSLWVDGNIVIQSQDFFRRINSLIEMGTIISVPIHPTRKCIYDEAQAIKELRIDNKNTVNLEMRRLRLSKYPKNNGLNETCIILRQHNAPQIIRAQNQWWNMVRKYSKRDQLSYNWAMWRNNIQTTPMYETAGAHRHCDELLFVHKVSHNQNPAENFDAWIVPRWLGRVLCIFILHTKDKEKFIKKHCT